MSYDTDIRILQYLTIFWLVGWLVWTLRRITRGDDRTVHFLQLVHFFFVGVPLILDVLIAPPEYTYQWGFRISQYDHDTNLVYLLLIAWVPPAFALFAGGRATRAAAPADLRLVWWARLASWTPLFAVPIVVALAPEPGMYLHYAAAIDETRYQDYQTIVTAASSLAVIGGMLLLAARNTSSTERLFAALFLLLALWINGKRNVVCLAIMLLLYLLWISGRLRGTRFLGALAAAAISFGAFSYYYQTQVRDIGVARLDEQGPIGESDLYVNYRIDFGRDAVMKQTIYAELNPDEMQILEHRGQSLLFYTTFFVPRSLWRDKPYPYSVYVTTTMMRLPQQFLYWGITTSWLEEAIANLGWLGFIAGPLLPARICAMGDRRRSGLLAPLTVSVASLLLVVQLAAFLPLFFLWIGAYVMRGRRAAPQLQPAAA